jgi:hypothetical protein
MESKIMVIKITSPKIITSMRKVKCTLKGLKITIMKEKILNYFALITLLNKIVKW